MSTPKNMVLNMDYNKGFQAGAKAAKKAVANEFIVRLEQLRNEPGIGPKTWEKVLNCLDVRDK